MKSSNLKEKILIFGNGQLGNFYQNYFNKNNIISSIANVDITNYELVQESVKEFRPTVVINTAAKTNLEWDIKHKLETFNVNVLGADNIAQVCDQEKVYYIFLSSGCILSSKDADDEKRETDKVDPISYYSWTKVWAENLITFKKSSEFKYLILRPRQPISAQPNYKNMLMKLLTFTKFIDTPNSGTCIEDLMEWTKELMDKRVTGTIHVANEGWTTPYQLGLLLKKYILPELPVNKISKEELNQITPEKRVDTVLNVDKLKSLVREVKPYKQRAEEIIIELGKNIREADKRDLEIQISKTIEQSKARTVVNDVYTNLLNS